MTYVSFDEASRTALFADSFSRLGAIMEMQPRMKAREWWRLLGEYWSVCDSIAAWRIPLARLMRKAPREVLDRMMNDDERLELSSLPGVLVVYRGCYDHNRLGLSWTLDRDVARRIVHLNRYRHVAKQPLLITGEVRREACVLKNDRQEREVISASVRRTSEVANE